MAVRAHVRELELKHAKLDEQIKTELKSPYPDTALLSSLKKQKLFIKEKIYSHSAG